MLIGTKMQEKEKQRIAMEITPKWRERKEKLKSLSVEELWVLEVSRTYRRVAAFFFFMFFILLSPIEYFSQSIQVGNGLLFSAIFSIIIMYINVIGALLFSAIIYGLLRARDGFSGDNYLKKSKEIIKGLKNGK